MPQQNDDKPTIDSLASPKVHVPQDVQEYMVSQYAEFYENENNNTDVSLPSTLQGWNHVHRVLEKMKTAPNTTFSRVNIIRSTREQIMISLDQARAAWRTRNLEFASTDQQNDTEAENEEVMRARPYWLFSDCVVV